MPHITRALIRKRAEHNEGIISTLEEISLHQEELESITEVLGTTCRKIKILYLQNNIIGKMENLHHLKELEYLNLALNNIDTIQGLDRCEFLNKLDLTVNFVDFDTLEESIGHLSGRRHLAELYMMGNPAQMDWEEGFEQYVVHRLPQLRCLDGKDVTKSMRLVAAMHFPRLELELRTKAKDAAARKKVEAVARAEAAEAKAAKKAAKAAAKAAKAAKREAREEAALASGGVAVWSDDDESDDDDADSDSEEEECPHTPEVRVEMYREMAEEKAEKEAREKERAPKERDYAKEQAAAIERTRKLEEEGKIRQCNEGKWVFAFNELGPKVSLDVGVPRHLDSSLIDVDVHPKWLSVVIKSKVLRLNLPAEVDASHSSAQRSKTTGHLVITMPKVNERENALSLRVTAREKALAQEKAAQAEREAENAAQRKRDSRKVASQLHEAYAVSTASADSGLGGSGNLLGAERRGAGAAAAPTGGAVRVKGLVPHRRGGLKSEPDALRVIRTTTTAAATAAGTKKTPPMSTQENATTSRQPPPAASHSTASLAEGDDDEPPPLF